MKDTNGVDWPSEGNKIGDDAHIHAVGQISLGYNFLEEMFRYLFEEVFPTKVEFAASLFHDLNNRKRVDLFKAIVSFQEKDPAVLDHLLYGMRCFDICTDNRNIIMHSISEEGEQDSTIIRLSKRAANDEKRLLYFDVPLADLRSVADEIAVTFFFIWRMNNYLANRRAGKTDKNTLPDKPPRQRKLTPSPPAEAGKGA